MAYFIRVDTEIEVAYELIAEPVQELPAGEQQPGEAVEAAPEEITNPADLQGSGKRELQCSFRMDFSIIMPMLAMTGR